MPVMPFGSHHPEVSDTTFVAPSATLIGDVVLGSDCAVMFGAVLRADRDAIRVGEGSNLQDNVVVHGDPGFPATIGRGVSVGHGAIVHGATIADHCLIGMGAILLNGCSIGEGSLIAAGAVIRPGTVIPPGSLVSGVPGQVKREVTEDERAHIRQNAATYRELARVYREG
jgi:carbonic anhydrase/acetyltransferase-like protein (isoleucine patch superfamily)